MKSTNGESPSLGYESEGVSIKDGKSKPPVIYSDGLFGGRDVITIVLLVTTVTLSCLLFYQSANNPLNMVLSPWKTDCYASKLINETSLEMVSIFHIYTDIHMCITYLLVIKIHSRRLLMELFLSDSISDYIISPNL